MFRILTSACRPAGISVTAEFRRASFGRRTALVSLLGLLLGTVQCDRGSTASDEAEAPPATMLGLERTVHEVGERAVARDYVLRVLRVQECSVEPHFKPDPGVQRLGVEVAFEGLSNRAVPVNPFYAVLVTPEGERFEPGLAGCQPSLRANRITEGQRNQGWLSFDVPRSASRLNLEYSPVVIGVGREELVFSVIR